MALRADAGVTTDAEGRVETWADQSGNGYDLSADMANSRPRLTEDAANGQPTLTFDGGDDHLVREDTLGIANDSPRTVVVVCRLADPTSRSPYIMQGVPGSSTQHYGLEANTFSTAGERFGVYSINRSYDSIRETDTNYHVHTLRTGSFSSVGEVETTTMYYIDGAETPLTPVSSKSDDETSFEGETTAIGSFPAEGTPGVTHDGEIAAIRVYDRAITSGERSTIESTLADRYGIGLA